MSQTEVPLCVDLDGSLTPVDTLHESLLSLVRNAPLALFLVPFWLIRGKAEMKHEIAARARFSTNHIPFNIPLVEWLQAERATGRRLVLATAADASIAKDIADRAGLFDEVLSSDGRTNLSGIAKREALVDRFGERGFDYVGNARADERVWASARKAIVVGSADQVARTRRCAEIERSFPPARSGPMVWVKALRLHQWSKNILIFLPALLAHRIFQAGVLIESVTAFFAFSLCASSIYLINDLLDLAADRQHPRKRNRPFAAGRLSARNGIVVSMILFVIAASLAISVGLNFAAVLSGYYILTWAYSIRLKQAALVDVMTLAGLYTIRIIAGSAATAIALSFWLLAFSVFIFLSLGIVKRYTEVSEAAQSGAANIRGRGYAARDLPLLLNLGVASGYCTVVVVALYLNSPDSLALYRHSKPLWLVCPLLMYWISRVWLLTTRGEMPDDPVVHAMRDRYSITVLILLALIVMAAI